ncbi:MAG: diguanylate cyclase [Deltaproteobacteria bacterium]|nr:diguanylate cyclase [Deltaproteobacteria bacterium]
MDSESIDYTREYMLIVDDEEPIRDALSGMLKHIGFQVDSASNGMDALKKLKEHTYTFVVTDICMPEMDGLELILKIKEAKIDVCIIAMTGYFREYKYNDVINAGATDFINKPFGIEEFEAKIRRAIIERNIRQELGRLCITDSLTNLYNQRYFYSRLKEEIARAQRQKHRLALIFFDLDHFKQYNDNYGHLAGDDLLKKVGAIINFNIRQGVDSGYRYGGDEFAIILIDTDENIGLEIGNRIERAIQKECNLGASTGYAIFSDGMTAETLMARADKQLYETKYRKKNTKP